MTRSRNQSLNEGPGDMIAAWLLILYFLFHPFAPFISVAGLLLFLPSYFVMRKLLSEKETNFHRFAWLRALLKNIL